MKRPTLYEFIALVVILTWVAASIDSIVQADYRLLQTVTPVVLIVVGAIYAPNLIKRKNGDDKQGG